MHLYHRPDIRAKDDKSKLPAAQILLVSDILVGRYHYREARFFRYFQKLAVFQLVGPAHFYNGMDFVIWKKATRTDRNVFIKQDSQRGDSGRK